MPPNGSGDCAFQIVYYHRLRYNDCQKELIL